MEHHQQRGDAEGAVEADRGAEFGPAGTWTADELVGRYEPVAPAAVDLGRVAAHAVYVDSDTIASEADVYPWSDAAWWQADGGRDLLATSSSPIDQLALAEFLAETPDAEFGSHDYMGWYGLRRHEDRPGGTILSHTGYGRTGRWATDSDDELSARWNMHKRQYEAFMTATRNQRYDDGRPLPRMWIGSQAGYVAGYLHGAWMNAALPADELIDAVEFMLANSHEPEAEEYAVLDYDGFDADLTRELGEYPNLEAVVQLARGITEHGPAYGAWAAVVGLDRLEGPDSFEDDFLGHWDSVNAYAEHLLEECNAYGAVEQAPDWLQPYIKLDVASYARDLGFQVHVVDAPEGGVWIFDAGR